MAGWIEMARWKLCVILGAVIIVGTSLAYRQGPEIETIPPKMRIAGAEVGGMPKPEAARKLAVDLSPKLDLPVELTLGERHWRVPRHKLGIKLDIPKMLTVAMAGDALSEKPQWVGLSLTVDPGVLRQYLQDRIAPDADQPGKNATLVEQEDGKLTVIPGAPGLKLDLEKAVAQIVAAPLSDRVALAMTTSPPDVTDADLAPINTLVARYSTHFHPSVRGRTTNLRLASGMIDGTLLRPGDIFSYNHAVGIRSASRGFKTAHIFIEDKVVMDLGGGMCQVSSTLYNMALLADLEIVERHPHMFLVDYIPPGQDATVAFGSKDFKFKNNTSGLLYLSLKAGQSTLTAKLYGVAPASHKIKIESVHTRGPNRITRAKVYREVLDNGRQVTRELLSRDTYKPQPKIVSPKTTHTVTGRRESTVVPVSASTRKSPTGEDGRL